MSDAVPLPGGFFDEVCPLCGGELRGVMKASSEQTEERASRTVVVMDCRRCGRFRMPEAAHAVLGLASDEARSKLADQLQARRGIGDQSVVDLSVAEVMDAE